MKYLLTILLIGLAPALIAQNSTPESLKRVKEKIEAVQSAKGSVSLTLDVDFINMPEKKADIVYSKGKPVEYTSDNFIFIPKKGLDFSWNNLFDYQFISVDRGTEEINNQLIQTLNIIPDDKRADFAIMTLKINLQTYQIINAEISTKNEGTYLLNLEYDGESALPSNVEASFELQKVKIPLNFMGNDTDIDRKAMRSDGEKTGKVFLKIDWSEVTTQ